MLPPNEATHFRCTRCEWSKTVMPKSDARTKGFDHFDECPRCGAPVDATQVMPLLRRLLKVLRSKE